ncbi:hypothetical protein G9A89_015228 [Geosiphon pyriformis]|nr:hypothetical protein G9A89_015228 [Geosiphon pyriformis]
MDEYDYLLAALVTFHVLFCPFTKVEESFNLQATHDVLEYGVSFEALDKYDHFEFPGVVPRTFVGPLALSIVSWPFIKALEIFISNIKKTAFQYIVRIILGLFTVFTLSRLRISISTCFGPTISIAFALLTACQFHTIFWASRTLPNMFAFPLSNNHLSILISVILAFSRWILSTTSSKPRIHLYAMARYLTFAMIVFRFEIFILAGSIFLLEIFLNNVKIWNLLKAVTPTGALSLEGISLVIDSYFWQKICMWPEGHVFYFNAILGKSVEWGVSEISFMPLTTFQSISDSLFNLGKYYIFNLKQFFGLTISHIFYYIFTSTSSHFFPIEHFCSFLGSKMPEIFAADGPICLWLIIFSWSPPFEIEDKSRHTMQLFNYGNPVSFNFQIKVSFELEYCGKTTSLEAFFCDFQSYNDYQQAKIHIDAYSAMTGVSRFGQLRDDWTYSKEESHLKSEDFYNYTHLITSTPKLHQEHFETLDVVYGYTGVKIRPLHEVFMDWSNFTSVPFFTKNYRLGDISRSLVRLSPIVITTEPKVWIARNRPRS